MASSVAAPTGVAVGRPRSKWTRVAALGFTLVAAGLVLWIAGMAIAGQSLGEDGVFLAGGVVAALLAAGAVWRFGTAGKAVAIVLGLAVMVMMFWVAFSVSQPASFVEFSGAVMWLVGVLTGVGYTIGSIVRRSTLVTEATRGETMAMRVMLGIVALALVVSAVLNVTMRTSVETAAAAGATTVDVANFEFEPATMEVAAGQPAQVLVHNSDAFAHNFVVEELDVNSGVLTPGSEKLVEINAAAGDYQVLCTLHPDMEATLTAR